MFMRFVTLVTLKMAPAGEKHLGEFKGPPAEMHPIFGVMTSGHARPEKSTTQYGFLARLHRRLRPFSQSVLVMLTLLTVILTLRLFKILNVYAGC